MSLKKRLIKRHKHYPVKFITKEYGDVWICLGCKKISKPDVFDEDEIDILIAFAQVLIENSERKKNNEKKS